MPSRWLVGALLAAIGALLAPIAIATTLVWEVSFGEKSCEISAEGLKEIADFADYAKYSGVHRIALDASASIEEAGDAVDRLAQCRGDAVKAQLLRDGVDRAEFDVKVQDTSDIWRRRARDWTPEADRKVIIYATERR